MGFRKKIINSYFARVSLWSLQCSPFTAGSLDENIKTRKRTVLQTFHASVVSAALAQTRATQAAISCFTFLLLALVITTNS